MPCSGLQCVLDIGLSRTDATSPRQIWKRSSPHRVHLADSDGNGLMSRKKNRKQVSRTSQLSSDRERCIAPRARTADEPPPWRSARREITRAIRRTTSCNPPAPPVAASHVVEGPRLGRWTWAPSSLRVTQAPARSYL